jgi:hypothetical protein
MISLLLILNIALFSLSEYYLLTTFTGEPAINAFRFSTAQSMKRCRIALGAQMMCGVMMKFFAFSGDCRPGSAPWTNILRRRIDLAAI